MEGILVTALSTEQAKVTERNLDVSVLTFASKPRRKEVIMNPENKLAMLLFDSGYYPEAFTGFEKVFELESSKLVKFTALTWMGHLKDLLGEREEAIEYYKQALEYDTGQTMQHDQFRMRINRDWVEKRLQVPFAWKKR